MAYSTVAMVRLALVPSSDGTQPEEPTNTAADLSDLQLQDAIAEADSTIDSFISKFYAVPVAPIIDGLGEDGTVGAIPHPIDYWSRNLAAYNATLSLRGSLDFTDDDPVARRYNATMAALKMVAAGQASLQLPDNRSTNASTGAGSAINPYTGTLWCAEDFSVNPSINPAWPVFPSFFGNPGAGL